MQDFQYLPPFEKDPNERRLNPFEHDYAHLGTQIGKGPITVMYSDVDNYKYIILVNTDTGDRIRIEL